MCVKEKGICVLTVLGLLLPLCGCMRSQASAVDGDEQDGISMTASFSCEDGTALCGGTVHLSFGGNRVEQSLDDFGETSIASLPKTGKLTMAVLDRQEQPQGTMLLSFSEGSVIDATTDESGVGHITIRKDTEEIALLFILRDDGSLLCTLRLSQSALPNSGLSQEAD